MALELGKGRTMKSILISIRPEWVAKILNGEKTIEVRRTAPKCDLPIDVYIYCTKSDGCVTIGDVPSGKYYPYFPKGHSGLSGKVVAKFTLNKIENFINGMNELEREWDGKPDAEYDYFAYEKALEKACLTYEEADEYAPDLSFYAWHISDLVIFDRPKELTDFVKSGITSYETVKNFASSMGRDYPKKRYIERCKQYGYLITKAPQSWCYCEEVNK